jgi:TonB family protein
MRRPKAIEDRGAESAVPLQAPLSARIEERLQSFALSLVLHAGLVTLLVTGDLPRRPPGYDPATAAQIIADQRHKVTLYTPKVDLPAVEPLKKASRDGAERALERFQQKIVADDPDPQSSRQKIVGPAPDIEIEQDIRSPNLLAWNAPKVSRPRFQVKQQQARTPEREALSGAAAPDITARIDAPSVPVRSEPRLRFQREQKAEPAPSREALAPRQAPELQAAAPKVDLAALDQQPKMRYWTPKAGPQTTPQREAIRGDAAPLIEVKTSGAPQVGSLSQQPRVRYQNWGEQPAAPERGVLTAGAAAPTIEGADGLGGNGKSYGAPGLLADYSFRDAVRKPAPAASANGPNGQLVAPSNGSGGPVVGPGNKGPNALVIGLDPDPNAVAAIPLGSRRGRFSASPDGGPGGGDLKIGSGGGASLRASNLSIDGAALTRPGPVLQQKANGVARPGTRGAAKDSATLSVFQRRRNVRELAAPPIIDPEAVPTRSKRPEILFLDRQVFVLAINTPNVTSYSGSWVIRFAERTLNKKKRHDAGRFGKENDKVPEDDSQGRLSAPGARLKVDPKYIRTAADEGVEGTVTLYAVIRTDGKIRDIEVVESLDERLDHSAMAALAQWEFHPATKLGVPVEVDVLIDIPFRLAPPEEKRVIQRF